VWQWEKFWARSTRMATTNQTCTNRNMKQTGVHGEKHRRPAARHWQTLSYQYALNNADTDIVICKRFVLLFHFKYPVSCSGNTQSYFRFYELFLRDYITVNSHRSLKEVYIQTLLDSRRTIPCHNHCFNKSVTAVS
jgi:hypothetical protein